MEEPKFTLSASPHIHAPNSSVPRLMMFVVIALIPSALWGVYAFGFRALLILLVSIGTALLTEYLLNQIGKRKKNTLPDGSALVTGLLIGMNMPASIPVFVPIIASFFAIAVAKWTFGGLGANWANPAIAGRVFVFFSFSSLMSSYPMPRALGGVDALASATPLSYVKTAISGGAVSGLTGSEIMAAGGYPVSSFAAGLSRSIGTDPYVVDAFFGNIGGCIGEVSSLLLIIGAIFLLVSRVITWEIPVSFLGSFALFAWVFGGLRNGLGLFSGDVILPLLSGGLILGACFMATDYVTSPMTGKGQIIFGVGCGFFTFLFRYYGSLPEATSLAILIMNIVTPTIDRYVQPRLFGYVKPEKAKKEAK